ncbi:MAG: ubiquitin-like small modifier protein 1 [Nitriliruptor sp.]|uniref:ubiquitin-like small modifier protein 1 n=1 Tax=Nitriliruptor sp. TaxID=2448056 RepID=UPI0034A03D1F
MATVRIPTVLRKRTGGDAKVEAEGATVGEVLSNVVAQHPTIDDSLFEDGKLRGFINVYVDDEDVRYLDGLDSKVDPDGEVAIMPAVAGGAQRSEHAPRHLSAGGAGA